MFNHVYQDSVKFTHKINHFKPEVHRQNSWEEGCRKGEWGQTQTLEEGLEPSKPLTEIILNFRVHCYAGCIDS